MTKLPTWPTRIRLLYRLLCGLLKHGLILCLKLSLRIRFR